MALFGKKPPTPAPVQQLPEELKDLLAKAQEERTKISSLLGRTKGSVEKLEKMDTPLRAVGERVEQVSEQIQRMEERAKQLEALGTRLEQLNQRAITVEQGQSAV